MEERTHSGWHEWFTLRGAIIALEYEKAREQGESIYHYGNPTWTVNQRVEKAKVGG